MRKTINRESYKHIIATTPIHSFYCRKCNKGHNSLYKLGKNSWCDNCVPQEIKEGNNTITINQNQKIINKI